MQFSALLTLALAAGSTAFVRPSSSSSLASSSSAVSHSSSSVRPSSTPCRSQTPKTPSASSSPAKSSTSGVASLSTSSSIRASSSTVKGSSSALSSSSSVVRKSCSSSIKPSSSSLARSSSVSGRSSTPSASSTSTVKSTSSSPKASTSTSAGRSLSSSVRVSSSSLSRSSSISSRQDSASSTRSSSSTGRQTSSTPTLSRTSPTPTPSSPGCAYEKCLYAKDLPAELKPVASSFCQFILQTTVVPVTVTATQGVVQQTAITDIQTTVSVQVDTTVVTTVQVVTEIPTIVATQDVTSFTTAIESGSCTGETVFLPAATFVNYPVRGGAAGKIRRADQSELEFELEARGAPRMPDLFNRHCSRPPRFEQLKAACRCFLGTAPTVTVTVPATSIQTSLVTAVSTVVSTQFTTLVSTVVSTLTLDPTALTSTNLVTDVVSTSVCTSTVIPTVAAYATGCGISYSTKPTASSVGAVTCANVAPPGATNVLARFEGSESEGTIFEGCIVSQPRDVTTPSGGTHRCDGTNNNANPAPGGTMTTIIMDAGSLEGFGFDGTYSNSFQDFFITRISVTTSTGNAFWGVLRNSVYTSRGGCQEEIFNGDEHQWIFDAFRPNLRVLRIANNVATAEAGQGAVAISVNAIDPNSGAEIPASGATIAGQLTDANGVATVPVPTVPGCYQYKATKSGQARSNAFYLNVVPSFGTAPIVALPAIF